jgi:formate/nitrite transporter FocA (FNT family)
MTSIPHEHEEHAEHDESDQHNEYKHGLEPKEVDDVEQRSSPGGKIVYHAVLKEADEELERSTSALFWSGLAAGLSMGFSLIAEALIRDRLPEHVAWSPLVSKLGYSVGFLVVILGRQQLFTENTLTPVLPLLKRKDLDTMANVLRLWAIVLLANLVGALAVALALAKTSAFDPEVRATFVQIGHEAMRHDFVTTFIRAIFAGWLIALLVWMLPYAESSHFFVILIITWLIGIGHFAHVIAGAVNVFTVAWSGEKSWPAVFGSFIVPALLGNIVGGVMLVAGLNHAQVVSGEE